MHIKQLVIQGFKSYKDQTVTDPFSPRHNVIVGRNGSGKSNFFAAIRFVLSDAYTHMSREERQSLLHEGSGTAVMSAYVEIIFDNADSRFPSGRDEVVLRRTIGLKKDEYSLDRKSASKSDVMNLLESAGFSRSNPYYIVPQGRITALTNAKDAERLALLKEVAGTQVYEQRRTESLKVMNESNSKREKIDELLQFLDDRLSELDEEKDELREYQEKDRERRCLEYTLLDRELKEINAHLDDIEAERLRNSHSNDDRLELFAERDQMIQNLETEIGGLKQHLALIEVDRKQLEEERKDLIRARAQAELQFKEVADNEQETKESITRKQTEFNEVVRMIQSKEAQLAELTPRFEQSLQVETEVKKMLAEAEEVQQRLYSKQGRNAQFRTKAERDAWLRKDIADIKTTIVQRDQIRIDIQFQLDSLTAQLNQARVSIAETRSALESSQGTLDSIQAQEAEQKRSRDVLLDERKELWREGAKSESALENARAELEKAERRFTGTMDRAQSAGLQAVQRIAKQLNLSGVYGPLCDLIEVDDKYKVAAEVTAGNSLFHVVVDNDSTASTIMDVLNRERSGRVTFVPLNRLKIKPVSYPKTDDAIPLIDKVQYDEKYAKAVEQVFSRTIICYNLDASSQYARAHNLNAITLQGDQANKKGVLTGGYHDMRHSRIDAVRGARTWREKYEELQAKSVEVKQAVARKDQEVTMAVSNLSKTEAQRQQLIQGLSAKRESLRTHTIAESELQEGVTSKQRMLESAMSNLESLNKQLENLSAELQSPFDRQLTDAEEQQLAQVTRQMQTLRVQDGERAATRAGLEQEKVMLELELRQVLYARRDQLQAELLESSIAGESDVASVSAVLARLEQSLASKLAVLEKLETDVEDSEAELSSKEDECSRMQAQQLEEIKSIERRQKSLERNMARRGILVQRKDEINRKIRDLGALPEEAFGHYSHAKSEQVLKRLHKLTDDLKKFSHINKKAFEQYTSFTRQRETLLERRQELEKSQESIEELIQVLDQRKDEAIERTFKQVSKGFAEVFRKLVPAGRGRLIMQRRMDRDVEMRGDDDGSESEAENSVENYVGVAISVSFNSKNDEQQRIEQLSGGQKSLCALALIFAIQQCDPAPFYLFDEIDANLDAQYRTAVASMIHELSENGQFICTTFRNEMIYSADKFYGVLFNNKISSIASITQDNALTFVEGEQTK
ncbi:RecF/RecN/SMC [Lipomyces arxii]|uniref:RecF/RecN/SMC n=1 Tax=Lipomyces arxii TaxID=56418 RepID=UPI0034D01DAF